MEIIFYFSFLFQIKENKFRIEEKNYDMKPMKNFNIFIPQHYISTQQNNKK